MGTEKFIITFLDRENAKMTLTFFGDQSLLELATKINSIERVIPVDDLKFWCVNDIGTVPSIVWENEPQTNFGITIRIIFSSEDALNCFRKKLRTLAI